MRIVKRAEFLAMPPQTLFSKYRPCVFDDLMIKGETWGNDFLYQQIIDAVKARDSGEFADILFKSAEDGSSFELDFDCQGRDGMFDADQLFAVWERKDVEALITRLQTVLGKGDAP